MKKWLAPIFGFIPFVYGVLATIGTNSLPAEAAFIMGPVMAAVFLVMWNRLAKIANFHICNDKKTILYMHIPGIIVFAILCMNAAATEPFLFGWFQNILLYYLMPVLPLSLLLSIFVQNVYFVYAVTMVFMVCAAYLGCNSKRRYVK